MQQLRSDAMCLFFDILDDLESPFPSLRDDSSSDLMQTIQDINKVMSNLSRPHMLYRGKVYAKPDGARFTFIEMMDTETYLHKLMASPSIREGILRNLEKLDKLMSNPACEHFPQLQLDLDMIEVLDGKCLRISQRKFIDIPSTQQDFRNKSPRTYIPFDSTLEPDAKFFKEGILNSFPDPETRVKFLNKFHQCLMAGKMPHKVGKLVVHGPKDPGKASWITVLLGIIPMTDVASITQERQFAAAMIKEHTQLVVLDEWSEYTLQSDMAKSVLQGGFMIKSVKHKTAKCIDNKAPFYITTNQLQNFGSEDINVQRHIVCFKTSSFQHTCTNADKWMKANCMHCIAWLISEIEKCKKLVDPDELWYEQNEHVEQSDTELFNLDEIKNLKITSSEQEIKQLKAVLYDPENCLDESFQREAERIFPQKNAERQENQQKEIEMDIENMSGDDEDPNAQTYQRRIYEELRGNFYRQNLKPSF